MAILSEIGNGSGRCARGAFALSVVPVPAGKNPVTNPARTALRMAGSFFVTETSKILPVVGTEPRGVLVTKSAETVAILRAWSVASLADATRQISALNDAAAAAYAAGSAFRLALPATTDAATLDAILADALSADPTDDPTE